MQSVDIDRAVAAAVAGSDSAWVSIIDSNVDEMWRRAVAEGLSPSDAAQVCQLAWLRLGQRLHMFVTLADVAEWLGDQVGREAAALADQRMAREQRRTRPDNVVHLAPGFTIAHPAEAPAHSVTAREFVNSLRRSDVVADVSPAPR